MAESNLSYLHSSYNADMTLDYKPNYITSPGGEERFWKICFSY